jgi:hypothetical protein
MKLNICARLVFTVEAANVVLRLFVTTNIFIKFISVSPGDFGVANEGI